MIEPPQPIYTHNENRIGKRQEVRPHTRFVFLWILFCSITHSNWELLYDMFVPVLLDKPMYNVCTNGGGDSMYTSLYTPTALEFHIKILVQQLRAFRSVFTFFCGVCLDEDRKNKCNEYNWCNGIADAVWNLSSISTIRIIYVKWAFKGRGGKEEHSSFS